MWPVDVQEGVPGFEDAEQRAIHPIYRGWATEVVDYTPAGQRDIFGAVYTDATDGLGAVDHSVVSLGDLSQDAVLDGNMPGSITLAFGDPCDPNTSLIENAINKLGTTDPDKIRNLAGIHPNTRATSLGTPFDLEDLSQLQSVADGVVDINDIRFVRLVDVPGYGGFSNSYGHAIYDPTGGLTNGFDLDAVGVLHAHMRPSVRHPGENVYGVKSSQLNLGWLDPLGNSWFELE